MQLGLYVHREQATMAMVLVQCSFASAPSIMHFHGEPELSLPVLTSFRALQARLCSSAGSGTISRTTITEPGLPISLRTSQVLSLPISLRTSQGGTTHYRVRCCSSSSSRSCACRSDRVLFPSGPRHCHVQRAHAHSGSCELTRVLVFSPF